MITKFTGRFYKNLDKLNRASVKKDILDIIENVEKANYTSEIHNIKKLQGHPNAYRIRSGDYRIGLFVEKISLNLPELLIGKIYIKYSHRISLTN